MDIETGRGETCDEEIRDWSDASISQGGPTMAANTRSGERPGSILPTGYTGSRALPTS